MPYFLLTATLPAELRPLARKLPRSVYSLLFQCTIAALLKLTHHRKYLGALPGIVAILHTWRRDLLYHLHIHCLVTGGGLSNEGSKWRGVNNSYLVNVDACSLILRAKFRDALNKAGLLDQVDPKVWKNMWVVHVKSVGNGLPALKYLAPYVFRAAITNRRIEKLEGDAVTFRYRAGRSGNWLRRTLKAEEFIRRFLQHVLPKGFFKVRYYGLLSPRNRHLLVKARLLLGAKNAPKDHAAPQRAVAPTRENTNRCPTCGTIMMLLHILPANRAPP